MLSSGIPGILGGDIHLFLGHHPQKVGVGMATGWARSVPLQPRLNIVYLRVRQRSLSEKATDFLGTFKQPDLRKHPLRLCHKQPYAQPTRCHIYTTPHLQNLHKIVSSLIGCRRRTDIIDLIKDLDLSRYAFTKQELR